MAWDLAVDLNTIIRSNDPDEPPIVINKGELDPNGNIDNLAGGLTHDLAVDPLGRGGKVTGQLKLAQQIVYAIINERTADALAAFDFREYEAVVQTALEALQTNQVALVAENDPTILGWDVERLNPFTNVWEKLNQVPVDRILTDAEIDSSFINRYRISRRNQSTPDQSIPIEIIEIEPPCERGTCELLLEFQSVVVAPSRTVNTFFFPKNRFFLNGEILEDIESVNVSEGSDPRQAVVSLRLKTVAGTVIQKHIPIPILQGISYF